MHAPAIPAELLDCLRTARAVTVFTGAGVSAESGIPTFRDALTGLWARFDASALATAEAFRADPELVWGWYEWRRMKVLRARPNAAHLAIAALQARLPGLTVVTQNVDDLHERAGSRAVLHLHGELCRPRCIDCGRPGTYPEGVPDEPEGGRRLAPPRCAACGGAIRPGVVWFGESLPEGVFERALEAAAASELLFVIGTSGLVMPAALLPQHARRAGARVVEINPRPVLAEADWQLAGAAGPLMAAIAAAC